MPASSYVGLGTQPPNPSWGRMLNDAQTYIYRAPLLAVFPGLAITFAVLGLNLLGDGLRDLLDPRLAARALMLELADFSVALAGPVGPLPILSDSPSRSAAARRSASWASPASGKSMTALAIMGLLPERARTTGGCASTASTCWRCRRGCALPASRARASAMVFQEPMTALNPLKTIGAQVAESLRLHLRLSRAEAREPRAARCSPASACRNRASRRCSIRTSSPAASASA